MSAGVELAWDTPAEWARRVAEHPLELLSDHAYCELGAAATAQSLITRHPDRSELVGALSALAGEELRHFRRVHALLSAMGGALGPPRSNPYAEALVRGIERGARTALLDRLLVAALIERRSLERFELLAEAAGRSSPELAALYRELGPSEAGHARLFVELARREAPGLDVDGRLEGWVRREAGVVRSVPFGPRIHSGPPPGLERSPVPAEKEGVGG